MSEIFQRKVTSVKELQDIAAELSGKIAELVYPELKWLDKEERDIIEGQLEEGIPNAVVRMFEKNPRVRDPAGLAKLNIDNIALAMAEKLLGRKLGEQST